ncbi:MAG: metallophosphoesterase [bacterium]
MFGTILILAATLMHVYVFGRAASVPFVKRHIPRNLLVGAGVLLWIVVFAARFHGRDGSAGVSMMLESIGMTWLGMLFLTSLSLLAMDLLTGFGVLLPRRAPSLRGWALVAGGLLSATALVQGFRPPTVEEYEVRLPGLPGPMDGMVLVAMSDLHIGSVLEERWLRARVEQVRALRPDLVVLLGDLFEGHGPPRNGAIPVLGTLSAPLGVWAVPGNHESHGGGDNPLLQVEKAGIRVLRNRWVEIRPGLVLAGVENLATGRRTGNGDEKIARALSGRPPGAAILLSHMPWQAERAAAAGAGLMLSGHTHGGQIWPFGYLTRTAFPLLDGEYDVGGMKVIVCRGTGLWGMRMRLWRPGQILRITLRTPVSRPVRGAAVSPSRGSSAPS